MNDVTKWTFGETDVRTIELDGEPWWVLSDVCKVLEIARGSRIAERLEDDEVRQTYITDSLGREQSTYIVNEPGLYSVILRSDKPQAKPFRKWVTTEVLPTIRKHGAYMAPDVLEQTIQNPDFLISLAMELKAEQERRKALESKIAGDKPKVIFADAVSESQNTILIGDLAKILNQNGMNTGQRRLFEELRNRGYLMKHGASRNMPTQRSMEMGLFKIKETAVTHADGHVTVNKTVKVTGKGQQYFINLFLKGV